MKSFHIAFLKLVNVRLLCVFLCFCDMKVVVRIGRWSDESCLKVVQRAELVRLVGSIVRSGEVGCWRCW